MVRRNRIAYVRDGRRLFVDGAALQSMIAAPPAACDPIVGEPAEPVASVREPPEPAVPPATGQGQRELTPVPRRPFVVFFHL